jgi:hypothetical protein
MLLVGKVWGDIPTKLQIDPTGKHRVMSLGHNPSTRLMPQGHKVSIYGTTFSLLLLVPSPQEIEKKSKKIFFGFFYSFKYLIFVIKKSFEKIWYSLQKKCINQVPNTKYIYYNYFFRNYVSSNSLENLL